jgi:serine/threonine-protein kinase mTOR
MCLIRQTTEQAIRILAALLKSTQAVVGHRVSEVLQVLLDRSEDPNPVVITHVLFSISQLTAVDTTDVISREIPRIMTIVLTSLSKGPQMRSAALKCLAHLCTNVGYVVVPIEQYPQLLPLLHGMLKREQSPDVRLQVVRVIGLLGAIDPVGYQVAATYPLFLAGADAFTRFGCNLG